MYLVPFEFQFNVEKLINFIYQQSKNNYSLITIFIHLKTIQNPLFSVIHILRLKNIW